MDEPFVSNKEKNWQKFMCTGKIEDYLNYCNTPMMKQEKTATESGAFHAGFYQCNGNDIETDACWRV